MGERALSGIRVVEFGQIAAGPFAGMLLADLGADVVKVEPPEGDGMRAWPPLVPHPDGTSYSLNFAAVNRNKRSVVADLKDPAQRERVRRLVKTADVLVENYRPGVMERLGLGFDDVASAHSGIVYCSVSGYGHTGPYRDRGAFDVVVQAMSGLMSVTGTPEGSPAKCGVPVGDFVAGLYAALSVLAGLRRRHEAGESVHCDCSMLSCLLAVSALQTSEYWGTGQAPQRLGSAHPRNAPYQAFRASDTSFVVAAGNDRLWQEVCSLVGQPELATDPRFYSQERRAANQQELAELLQSKFLTRPAAFWMTELELRGVPCGPVYDYAEALGDPHVSESRMIRSLLLPNGEKSQTTVFPVRITGQSRDVYRSPPLAGEHTEEVIAEWLRQTDQE